MIRTRPIAALALTIVLAACASSPPAQFFTLDAVAPGSGATHNIDTPVQVAAVHIPAILDRQEMVRKTGANTLAISDRHRWAAPLGTMIRQVLTRDLAQRLPKDKVVLPKESPPANTGQIVLDILDFTSDASGTVRFDGSWSLLRGHSDQPALARNLHLSASANPADYAGQAQAMDRILGQIADAIAAGVANETPSPGRH